MIRSIGLFLVFSLYVSLAAAEPCKSGLAPNQRPGPYSALVCVGPQRGQQHCFICEAGDRPLVIVFARGLSEPLGKLARQLDQTLKEQSKSELRSWITFLADDQTSMDPKVVKWAQNYAVSNVPCAVFEDTVGPPAYLIARDADVTVLLALNKKVVANFAYRAGELDTAAIQAIVKTIPKLVNVKK
jgi:hypothetical protein